MAPSSWTFEAGRERVGVLRLDVPGRDVNVLTEDNLRELDRRLDEAVAARFDGLVLASGKPGTFIAGADVDAIMAVTTAEEGAAKSRLGQAVLRRLSRLGMPTVAAIHGACVGGGAELAAWCTARTCTREDRTRIGFPEVKLGIVPGFGGTQVLPGLVGLPQAIGLATTGRLLGAREALRIGLVDSVVEAEWLLDDAAALARRCRAEPPSRRHLVNAPGIRDAVAALARRRVMAQTHGRYPAALEAVRLCRLSLSATLDAGLAEEAQALGRLLAGPVARNLLHVYALTRAADRLGEAPPPGAVVGVLGAGVMGGGIAGVALSHGFRARLRDVKEEALAQGVTTALETARRAARSAWNRALAVAQAQDRLGYGLRLDGFADADLVVEAVVERQEIKRLVLAEAEAAVGADGLLVTNTSSLPVGALAEALQRPERFAGMHFFNPVPRMPLVEVVRGPRTSDRTVARVAGWARAMGKHAVVVADSPGFLVNRMLMPYLAEAFELLGEGVSIDAVDDAAVRFGMPMGPFRVLDEVGLDVALHVSRTFAQAFPGRFAENALLARLVADGRLGRKAGRGFREWRGDRPSGTWSGLPAASRELPASVVQDRLVLRLADEGLRCLEEGVVASAGEVDLASVMGLGFPPFRGGSCRHVHERGAAAVLARLRELEAAHGARFAPSARLAEVASGRPLYPPALP